MKSFKPQEVSEVIQQLEQGTLPTLELTTPTVIVNIPLPPVPKKTYVSEVGISVISGLILTLILVLINRKKSNDKAKSIMHSK